jgi:SAM-dependent methyltransferase
MNRETTPWTVPELLLLSGGYWATCALHAAVRLDVFSPLTDHPQTAAALAARLRTDPRGTRRLLETLAALGLVTREADNWSATPFAARHLARQSPDYLGHIIRHHHLLMDGWSRLHEAVTGGAPVRERSSHADDEQTRESFLMGMDNLAGQMGPRLAAEVDLSGRRRLLDLGGGPGTYAIHFCRANAELTAVVCDLPTTRAFAERTIAAHGLSDRIAFAAADFNTEPLPGGFDAAWLSHVLHGESPAGAAALLRKAAAALQPGGLLLVQEFILDDSREGPLFPALFSLNMLVGTPGGQAYSGAELAAMLTAAGAGQVRRLPLELPNGAGVMAGVVAAGHA